MNIISPSLLAADQMNMERDIKALEASGADWLHIDVMDSHFVPNFSFGYSTVSAIDKISDKVLDVHLMIERPLRYVEQFCRAGADYLTIHVEADTPENISKALDRIAELGVMPGISVKPGTPASAIEPYLKKCALVLIMTVEPGFGGQKFMENMLPKITEVRSLLDKINPACHVQVDGGVDLNTAKLCKASGANVLVAGSACFKSNDMTAFISALKS